MLSLAPNVRSNTNPAPLWVTGSISNAVDWVETITIVDRNGDQVTGVGSDTWTLQLRDDKDDTAADLTLISPTNLTISVGATTTLAINADSDTVSALNPGDYIIDIASETSGGMKTHRASGRVSVVNSPVSF